MSERAPGFVARLAKAAERRSLLLFAGGALLGLILGGVSLFRAAGSAVALVPPEDVATVNQRPILTSDYVNQLASQFGVSFAEATPEQKRKVLADMVDEELMVQRGLELDLPGTDGDVRAALVNGVELQVGANVMAARPSEAQLRAFYQRYRERYRTNGTLQGDELVLPPGADIMAARSALLRGEPAAIVAQKMRGRVTGRLAGETFDLTARLTLGDPLYLTIEELPPGGVSAPVRLADGVHLIRIVKRLKPVLPPFESAIKTVYADYLQAARAPVEAANRRFLRRHARILYAPGFGE